MPHDGNRRWLVAAAASFAAALLAAFVDVSRRDVWIAAAQGIPVLVALLIAMRTLNSGRADSRVERTLTIHRELTTGELGHARWRLANHLRLHATNAAKVRVVGLRELSPPRTSPEDHLSQYERSVTGAPRHDATSLLRFFERVEVAWDRDTLDKVMLCRLVGRHAGWWDLAFEPRDTRERTPLTRLAQKLNTFVKSHPEEADFNEWWAERQRDFRGSARLTQMLNEAEPRPAIASDGNSSTSSDRG